MSQVLSFTQAKMSREDAELKQIERTERMDELRGVLAAKIYVTSIGMRVSDVLAVLDLLKVSVGNQLISGGHAE
jgi:phosphoenolpyruvate carboxylase